MIFMSIWLSQHQAASDGVAALDEFVGGLGDVPDCFGKTPVDNRVNFACLEFNCVHVFSFAGVDLQECPFSGLRGMKSMAIFRDKRLNYGN